MYIKKLRISNFKSYRKETVLMDMTTGLNMFFGRNGAGKSNLFEAIQFILKGNKKCSKNSLNNSRLRILSDNSKGIVSVELTLVFDSADYILKKEMDALGFKYYVDGLKMNFKNFSRVLQNLGFPDSPEFYFVDRSLFKNIILCSSEERLGFFISNLGMSISKEMEKLQKVISETERHSMGFSSFEDYLKIAQVFYENSKDADIAKWKKFQKLQKRKEYLFLLNRYKSLAESKTKYVASHQPEGINHEESAKQIFTRLRETSLKIDIQETFLAEIEKERLEIVQKTEKVDLELEDLHRKPKTKARLVQKDEENLQNAREHLSTLKSKTETEKTKLDKLMNELKHHECERDLMIEHLGPKKDHDWSNQKIKMAVEKLKVERTACENIKKDIQVSKNKLERHQKEMENAETLERTKIAAKIERKECSDLYSDLQVKLAEISQNEFHLECGMENLKKELIIRKNGFARKAGVNTVVGMESVFKVIQSWKESNDELADSYYGMVVDNFECNPGFYTAIDATVGNHLFSHVIQNNQVGLEILKKMDLLGLRGEVVFIPLNRINPEQNKRIDNANARALLAQLKFPLSVEKAIKFCFGNIFICRDLETAADVSKSYRCKTSTLEGDVISASGVMNGGYRDITHSSIDFYKKYISIKNDILNDQAKLDDCRMKSAKISDEINQTLSRLQKLEGLKYEAHSKESVKNEIKWVLKNIESLEKTLKERELQVSLLLNQINILQSQPDYNPESLKSLNKKVIDLKKKISMQHLAVLDSEKKLDDYENLFQLFCSEVEEAKAEKNAMSLIEKKISDLIVKKELLARRFEATSEKIDSIKKDLKHLRTSEEKLKILLEKAQEKAYKLHFSKEAISSKIMTSMRTEIEGEIKNVEGLLQMKSATASWFSDKNLSQAEIDREMIKTKNEIKKLGKVVDETVLEERIKKQNKIATLFKNAFDQTRITNGILTEYYNWFQNHISEMVSKLSDLIDANYKVFLPNQGVHLNLENEGLGMDIVTSGGSQLLPQALSGGQKTALVLSTVLAFVRLLHFGICIFDEIDQFLSEENIDLFTRFFIDQMSDVQFFAASHKKSFIRESDALFLVKNFNNKSVVMKIDKEKTDFMDLVQPATKDSSCTPEDETYSF